MTWYLSDEVPEIPGDILDWLDRGFDRGDCGDVAQSEAERSRVRRVVALNQQLHRKLSSVQYELHDAQTSIGHLKGQVQELVRIARRAGWNPTPRGPG